MTTTTEMITAKDLLSAAQSMVDEYGEDSPVFYVYFNRCGLERAVKDLQEEGDTLKPLTDELVEQVFAELRDNAGEGVFLLEDVFKEAASEVLTV